MAFGVKSWIAQILKDRSLGVSHLRLTDIEVVGNGVLQGSVPGPLLFVMYVNGITNGMENQCLVFADDTKLSGRGNSEAIQRNLDKVYQRSRRLDAALSERMPASHGSRS